MDFLIFHFIAMTVFFNNICMQNYEGYFIPNADYLAHHGQMKVYTIYNGRFIFRKEQQKNINHLLLTRNQVYSCKCDKTEESVNCSCPLEEMLGFWSNCSCVMCELP